MPFGRSPPGGDHAFAPRFRSDPERLPQLYERPLDSYWFESAGVYGATPLGLAQIRKFAEPQETACDFEPNGSVPLAAGESHSGADGAETALPGALGGNPAR